MHLRRPFALIVLCIHTAGCLSKPSPRRFHVDPVVAVVEAGPEAALVSCIHDEAVRSGRAQAWTDASSPDSAALLITYAWRRESAAASDRFRLVCRWRTSEGGEGEVTDGLAMPAHFWTESRAGEASARLCEAVIRTAGPGRRSVP